MASMYYSNIIGWMDWEDLYDEVAISTPPYSTIVEVGVAFGKSLFYLAEKIKEVGRPGIQIVAVDRWQPYEGAGFCWQRPEHPDASALQSAEVKAYDYIQEHKGYFEAFIYNLKHSPFVDDIRVLRADSLSAAYLLATEGVRSHFVFIDADHEADAVKQDIDAWWDLGPEWMAGHDYNRGSDLHFPGVWKTVDAKFGQENVEWRGQTCWVVRRAQIESLSNGQKTEK